MLLINWEQALRIWLFHKIRFFRDLLLIWIIRYFPFNFLDVVNIFQDYHKEEALREKGMSDMFGRFKTEKEFITKVIFGFLVEHHGISETLNFWRISLFIKIWLNTFKFWKFCLKFFDMIGNFDDIFGIIILSQFDNNFIDSFSICCSDSLSRKSQPIIIMKKGHL